MKPVLRLVRCAFGATAIVVGVFCSAAAAVADAQEGGISQELRAMVDQYVSAWDTHDPSFLVKHFTADADMIMGNGPILSGRLAIQNWWRQYFAAQELERTLSLEIQGTRAIATDVVVLNVRTTTGGRTDQGTGLPARRARGTWVVVQQGGDWFIAALRGMPTEQDRIIRSHDQPNR